MTKLSILLALSFIALGVSACQPGPAQIVAIPASAEPVYRTGETYPVDPIFQEFYGFFGGEAMLGPALTPLNEKEGLKTQYVQSALLLYEARATENERYRLAPLGAQLGISEPPVPDPGRPNGRYLNGHTVYSGFLPLYEKLGGARFVGKPLSEARHNPDKKRIEQYFENLGFYQLEQDAPGTVRLLAYGSYVCDQRCRYLAPSASLPRLQPVLPEPFAARAARLGIEVTGRILAEPHLADDGRLEVIFENLVMILETEEASEGRIAGSSSPGAPAAQAGSGESSAKSPRFQTRLPLVVLNAKQVQDSRQVQPAGPVWLPLAQSARPAPAPAIGFRQVAHLLDLANQLPVTKREDPVLIFYPVEAGLGFHVPVYFQGFLEWLGGLEVSGAPVSEVFEIGPGLYRQCFATLCLDFEPGAPENQRLRLAPLGYLYKERFFVQPGEFGKAGSLEGVELRVWESQPYAGQEQGMVIHLAVLEAGKPLPNREASLTVTLPDGSQEVHRMQPTNAKGQAFLRMPPIPALNGTLIAYQVCLDGIGGEELCVEDHYLVWEY